MSDSINNNNRHALEHVVSCYANAQDIIRFLDTKAAAVIGYVTLLGAIPFVLTDWVFSSSDPVIKSKITGAMLDYPTTALSLSLLLVAGLLFCILALFFAVSSSAARFQPKNSKRTLLFPAHTLKSRQQYDVILNALKSDYTHTHRVDEYLAQIPDVGIILHKKMCRLRVSSFCLMAQIASLGGFAVVGIKLAFVVIFAT